MNKKKLSDRDGLLSSRTRCSILITADIPENYSVAGKHTESAGKTDFFLASTRVAVLHRPNGFWFGVVQLAAAAVAPNDDASKQGSFLVQ